jgi:tRNA(Ile)-lysidine synthase
MDLLKAFQQHWAKTGFGKDGKQILLAVSGGVDSMVMADLFLKSGIDFGLAHCNFQLRGEEADRDEALVQKWADDNKVVFYNTRFNTKEKTEEWKKGVQETARILRYEWLDQIRHTNGFAYIATAHHANDNVETLLMNLFKGTGISGLHGIPVQNNFIIRPLLFAERKDIAAYAATNNIPYREDASNASDNYLRNMVRHHLIPAVEKCFPDGVQQANESINRFAEAEKLYNVAIDAERKKLLEQRGQDHYIPVLKLNKRVPLHTICYELFKPFGFTGAQVPYIISLLDAESGKSVMSSTHRVIRNRDFLIVTALQTEQTDFVLIEGVPCVIETPQGQFYFKEAAKGIELSTNDNEAMIDASKISYPLILRKWKQGDYLYPLGMGMKKKKLSKLFIDKKIPLHEKEHIWVLESQKRIVWVAGLRLDERFKITDTTANVLKIELKK